MIHSGKKMKCRRIATGFAGDMGYNEDEIKIPIRKESGT